MRNILPEIIYIRKKNCREIWFGKITTEVRVKFTSVFSNDNLILANLQHSYWIITDRFYQEVNETRRNNEKH